MYKQKYEKMILWVLKENYPSRRFYESLGGQLQSQEKMYKWDGREVAIEVAYLWKI